MAVVLADQLLRHRAQIGTIGAQTLRQRADDAAE